MPKKSQNRDNNEPTKKNGLSGSLENEVDQLFQLPLSDFIAARKALAARLKQVGHQTEAERVKVLAKPSTSAWAVNQLYWQHRETFDELIVAGERFRKAQTSRGAGRVTDMREALDVRRKVLSDLEELAADLLRSEGHNPTLDMLRRITTTLEALSAYDSSPEAPKFGRMSHDVDPPGFESLGAFGAGSGITERIPEPRRVAKSQKSEATGAKTREKEDLHELKEKRQAKIAAAKVSLQNAKRELTESRANLQSAQADMKRASAELKGAEKLKRDAELRLEQAEVVLAKAGKRAQGAAADTEEAMKAVEEAERAVREASKELESVFRQGPG